MPNLKFSQFDTETTTTSVTGIVGYNTTANKNIQITPTNFINTTGGPYLPLAGGTMTGVAGVVFPDSFKLNLGTGSDFQLYHNGTKSLIVNVNGDLDIQNQADDGDILFKSDDGSGGVATYLTLDGSTTNAYFSNPGNVGIGTTSPAYKLAVYGSSTDSEIVASFGSANDVNEYTAIGLSGFIAGNDATKAGLALERTASFGTGKLHFLNNSTVDDSNMTLSDSRMVIDTAGNVGIGTTSPARTFDVLSTDNIIARFKSDSNKGAISVEDNDTIAYISAENNRIGFGPTSALSVNNITINTLTNNVGIGNTTPASKLVVDGGDIEIDDSASGLILRSPDGTRYRVTVANGGAISASAV